MRSKQIWGGLGRNDRAFGCVGLALLLICLVPSSAQATFGFKHLGIAFTDEGGSVVTQAGAHPFAWTTAFTFNTEFVSEVSERPDQELKDLRIQLPPGLIGTPALLPRCVRADFFAEACPASTVVGEIALHTSYSGIEGMKFPLFNLEPVPGEAAELGFIAAGVPVKIEITINPAPPYNLVASISHVSQAAALFGADLSIDGAPGGRPFLTLPRNCSGPPKAAFEADSWQQPGSWTPAAIVSPLGGSGSTDPLAMTGCDELGFDPTVGVRPTTAVARGPTGLDFSLDIPDEGLTSATGTVASDLSKAVLTLPEGMTVNPSVVEGLGACTLAVYERETLDSASGAGCPDASKIGTAEVESPLLKEPLAGNLFVAQPDDPATGRPSVENPFDSLLAIYAIFRNPKLGIFIKQAIEIEPDSTSGRLTATIDDIPQLPFSHFELHLRDGARSPLTTPPACGTHTASYELTPSSGAAPLHGQSSFTLDGGCASPRFAPTLSAGTVTPRAGAASSFVVDLTRSDDEQNLSALELVLPPGITADFGSVPPCPATLAAAGACPGVSRIGFARIAAGVGTIPVWVPRPADPPSSVYLAGPYEGAPFSLVVAVPARGGPFDLGTAVVRAAIFIDPRTAQAKIHLDLLPQILDGIPISYRAIHLVVDRPGLVFNPTSCAATAVQASVGSATGTVAVASDRFQAHDCAALGFRPKVSVRLLGPTHRGAHPSFRTVMRTRPGDANVGRVAVTLPGAELLDSRHFGAICTESRFADDRCPAASVYGHAKAWSPMLDRPLEGPVYLRASHAKLPDLAASLGGRFHLDLVSSVDSVRGRLRIKLQGLPDVPLSKVVLTMRGGRRGLLVNTGGLCASAHRAVANFKGQNGKRHEISPVVKTDCGRIG